MYAIRSYYARFISGMLLIVRRFFPVLLIAATLSPAALAQGAQASTIWSCRDKDGRTHVITSYSIHYTKLYEIQRNLGTMKITPLEIRQKAFEKVFRGYDKDEVNAFLQILSTEWEKSLDEKKELTIKLESLEKEITKLREVENSLYKTLKTAEDTGANMIQQANKAAELQLKA